MNAAATADILSHETATVWKLAAGACAAWCDESGRWLVYVRDGSWIARDRSLPAEPREHGRDQERAFYTGGEMVRYLRSAGAL